MNAIVAGKIEKTSGAMVYKKIDNLYMGSDFYKTFYVPTTSYIYIRDYYNSRFLITPIFFNGELNILIRAQYEVSNFKVTNAILSGNQYAVYVQVDRKLSSVGDYGEISYGTLEIS